MHARYLTADGTANGRYIGYLEAISHNGVITHAWKATTPRGASLWWKTEAEAQAWLMAEYARNVETNDDK